jgi:hypothetical protein
VIGDVKNEERGVMEDLGSRPAQEMLDFHLNLAQQNRWRKRA